MAKFILKSCGVLVGSYDLTSDVNQINLQMSVDVPDATNFDSGNNKEKIASFVDWKLSYSGFVNISDPLGNEQALFDQTGASELPVTLCPLGKTVSSIAYFGKALNTSYKPGGQHGEIFKFDLDSEGQGSLVNGTILLSNKNVTATGVSTPIQLGQVAEGKKLYGIIHVTSIAGTATPTITATIQSCATQNGTYVDRISFEAITDKSGIFATPVSGAITDTWWKVNYTITGINPVIAVHVAMGIQ